MLLVVLSNALFFYETLDVEENPENSNENPNKAAVLETIDNVVMFFFTIEYVLRLITSPNTLKFFAQPMNIIDLLALIPFYLGILLQQLEDYQLIGKAGKMVRLIRIMRLMRLFKLARHLTGLVSLLFVLKSALTELLLVLIIIMITILSFASLLYTVENAQNLTEFNCKVWKENSRESGVDAYLHPCYVWTFFDSFWLSLMNITTCGHAIAPQTVLGKFVAGLCTICGVFILKLPIPIIVNSFAALYDNRKRRANEAEKRKQKRDIILVLLFNPIILKH